jgi:uncharacterized membrane protein (DUF4010 family)
MSMTPGEALTALAVAVAAGGLIGAERQQAHAALQKAHAARAGEEFGGIRTYPLLAIVGVIGALLQPALGAWVIGALLVAVVVALGIAQARSKTDDVGVSSEIAAIVTFGLGVLSATPALLPDSARFLVVAGIAATTMALLALKRPLHGFAAKVSSDDVYATAKFVVLALVVIPLLPNRTFGPLDVLNPRKVGLMIALVAGVSFAGYVAARLVGSRRGLLIAGLIGGLVSSTALTLALSTRAKEQPALARSCAVGIVAGCSTMFPRVLLVVAVTNFALLRGLAVPLGAMAVTGYAATLYVYFRGSPEDAPEDVKFKNPFELKHAVQFGLLYGVILFVAKAAQEYVGTTGVLASAALAGLADVDAITLSLAELHRSGAIHGVAVPAIALATVVNSLVKIALATLVGGKPLGSRVAPMLLVTLLAGGAALSLSLALG